MHVVGGGGVQDLSRGNIYKAVRVVPDTRLAAAAAAVVIVRLISCVCI